jgi:hypothetical protein
MPIETGNRSILPNRLPETNVQFLVGVPPINASLAFEVRLVFGMTEDEIEVGMFRSELPDHARGPLPTHLFI